LDLLPLLAREYNSNIVEALVRLAANAGEDRAYFGEATDALLRRHAEDRAAGDGGAVLALPLSVLRELHPASRRRLIVRAFERTGLPQDIAAVHLRAADALLRAGKAEKTLSFPNGYSLSRRGDSLFFFRGRGDAARAALSERGIPRADLREDAGVRCETAGHVVLVTRLSARDRARRRGSVSPAPGFSLSAADSPVPGPSLPATDSPVPASAVFLPTADSPVPAFSLSAADSPVPDPGPGPRGALVLDFDLLFARAEKLTLRSRRPGDWIRPSGMRGRKKLQDFFVDAKIPRADRDGIPLIAAEDEILWVCGCRNTGDYAIRAETKQVLLLEYAR
jgi:tRNA(Ile)-lysidine synthetase-like protein